MLCDWLWQPLYSLAIFLLLLTPLLLKRRTGIPFRSLCQFAAHEKQFLARETPLVPKTDGAAESLSGRSRIQIHRYCQHGASAWRLSDVHRSAPRHERAEAAFADAPLPALNGKRIVMARLGQSYDIFVVWRNLFCAVWYPEVPGITAQAECTLIVSPTSLWILRIRS